MGSVSGSVGDGRGSGGGMGGGCVSVVVWGGAANLRRNLRFRSVARPEPDNPVLVKLLYFCDYSRFVPPAGGRASLILDADMVSYP